MEKVKQYIVADGLIDLGVKGGTFVRLEDYAALQQKLDAMGRECGKMLGLLNDICRYHEECTHDDMMHALIPLEYVSAINTFVERDVDGENPFAATDAFLNEVRAEGVEMFAKESEGLRKLHFERGDKEMAINADSRAMMASLFADQLRAGNMEGEIPTAPIA